MRLKLIVPLVAVIYVFASDGALAHDENKSAARPEELGRVLFKTSCTPEAQKQFERALAMLHSFFFPETVKAFTAIAETDPNCAIAYWGIAISARPNPLVGPFDAATLKRGLDAVEKGEAIGAKTAARARLACGDRRVLQGLRQGRPGHAHARTTRRRWRRSPRSTPTTSRRRSSTRSH